MARSSERLPAIRIEIVMGVANSNRPWVISLVAVVAFAGMATLHAQTPMQSPAELVRKTVENEVSANNGGAKFMFRDRKETPHGSQTRLVVETKEATAGILVAIDDKPLTPEQLHNEEARLNALANDPEELKKKQKAEREDSRRSERIVRAFPDAFLFEFDGSEPGSVGVGKPGVELTRLKFRPNPNYDPPSHTEQVLTGMQGYILIDPSQHRIAKIDGTLFKEVGFGWGILGHLDKGGRFLVQQVCVGNDDWEVSRMNLLFSGKELLFKGFSIKSDEVLSDFHPAPRDLTFAQAVELLKKQSTELAANASQIDRPEKNRPYNDRAGKNQSDKDRAKLDSK
jgi:hypothetical protein